MNSVFLFLCFVFSVFLFSSFVSGAHFVVGYVSDAKDGAVADDNMIVVWNPASGINDNLTDVVGVNGNSGSPGVYMVDCELLSTPCQIGDEIRVKVFWNYNSDFKNLTITGAGFDLMENLSLNSPPNISSIIVDDGLRFPIFPENEIDLIAASSRNVLCEAVVEDLDGDVLKNARAEFFSLSSFYGDVDDNNYHYTNNSCYLNSSYGGENETKIVCGFDLMYYSNYGDWSCFFYVEDNLSSVANNTDETYLNPLLSVGAVSSVDFGELNVGAVSEEKIVNITNYGNVDINLSLSGYSGESMDGFAMNCSVGENISIGYQKYNLTSSTPGVLNLSSFENRYLNLTSDSVVREFELRAREDDFQNNAFNETYWRIYVPVGVGGSCQGNIVFGAVQSSEI